jgi:hypothetical protein
VSLQWSAQNFSQEIQEKSFAFPKAAGIVSQEVG